VFPGRKRQGVPHRMQGPMAYTDGACLGNPGPGGWGVRILYADGRVREFGGGGATTTTNNRMELQAAIEALKALQSYPQATVVTDSRYVIDGLTKWIFSWRRRGWLTTAQTPVKNRQLWMLLDRLNHPGVHWQHVGGHTGDPDNERVDDIARAFAQGIHPELFCGMAGSPSDPVAAVPAEAPRSNLSMPGRAVPQRHETAFNKARYVSIVQGTVALDDDWQSCAQRVRGVSGAKYKKVHSAEELAAFCARYGVAPPTDV
jgi:ribonuclease HI